MDYEELAKKIVEEQHLQSCTTIANSADNAETQNETQENVGEISDEVKAMAIAEIVADPQKAINAKLSGVIAEKIDNDENVGKRVDETAGHIISSNLNIQENKAIANDINSQDDVNEANFKKYQSEYRYHGIDHKVDKVWKTKIMSFINDVWFAIFAFISFFTIVPVSIFIERMKVLHGFVKWIYVALGIVLILGILFGIVLLIFNACGYDLLAMLGVK